MREREIVHRRRARAAEVEQVLQNAAPLVDENPPGERVGDLDPVFLVDLHASDAGASVAPCRREHLCATRVEPAAVRRSVDQAAGDENTGSGV